MTRSSRSASAVKDLDAEDRREWSGAARSDQLVELLEVAERLQAADRASGGRLGRAGGLGARRGVEPAVVAHAPGADHGGGRVEAGGHGPPGTRKHEATGEALRSGDVSCAHVEVLAPMVRNREAEYARNEDVLLGAAKSMRADDFGIVARHWRGIANDEMSELDARDDLRTPQPPCPPVVVRDGRPRG